MRAKKTLTKIISVTLLLAILLIGCSSDKDRIPFSDLSFDTTYDQMVEKFGEPESNTESYLGTSYQYASDYMKKDGKVRYTFSDDGKLASITWLFESEDGEEVSSMYEDIHKELVNKHGETKESNNTVTQLSDIWRLDSGNITLVAVISSDYNGLMYSYIAPEYSHSEEDIQK